MSSRFDELLTDQQLEDATTYPVAGSTQRGPEGSTKRHFRQKVGGAPSLVVRRRMRVTARLKGLLGWRTQ
jgi:hypothetical protein